ncbi:helix-turn-helix transcriptional regulator [Actinomadura sp. 9N407]|uniref:helix-turn-helix transcriptional regulator n=1 Tax=Actinomadura sp. 9N407 TaxID=3375154 RepID=UPI0037AA2157
MAGDPPLRGCEPELRGRDAEVADLTGWISRLCEGRGGVFLVEGVPGAGKSRLAREAQAIAEGSPIRVLSGTGERDRQSVPFGALLEALASDGPVVVDERVLLTLSESAEQPFWLFRAVQDQLKRAALDRPLLVVIDDLQWCDAGTLLALRTLPARLSSDAIGWLVTVRTGSSDADVRGTVAKLAETDACTLRLGRLPEDAVTRITRDLLDAEPGGDILDLLRQAEGRPLLVTETIRGLLGEGAITRTGAVAHLTGRHSPIHSYGSAQRLLGHLSPLAREVLQLASVLGRDLEADRLADLSGHTIAELVAALQDAVDADLVRPTDPLTFRHDIVRETIRGTVPVSLRRAMRKQAADLRLAQGVPIGQVALTMAETAEPGDAEAVALLRRALAELAQVSPDAAVPIARQAVALAPAGSAERADAVAEALPLLARIGLGGEGLMLAEPVLDGPLPATVEGRVRLGAAMSAMQGSFAEVLRHSRAGTRLDCVPDGLRAPLMALRCLATLLTGDVPAAERLLAPATESALRAGSDTALALIRTTDSLIRADRLDFTAAERLAAEAAASAPDASAIFFPAIWRALLHGMTGKVEEGLRETAEGVAAARRPGHAQGLNLWLTAHARLLLAGGRLAEARAAAEAALAMTRESGAGDVVSFDALSVIGRVGALTGDSAALQRATAHAERMLASEVGPRRQAGAWPAAQVANAVGDPRRAPVLLDQAAATCGPPVCTTGPADDPSFVRLALRAGRAGHAAAVVTEAEHRAARNPDIPLFAAVAAHARGLLDEDVEAVQRAVGILDGLPCLLPLSSALEDAGRLLLKSDRGAAIEYLNQAESIYARMGAGNETARVRRRLDAAGHRQRAKRRRTAQGWDALTPAEQRVASLVAEGATNRQAADKLFLSPATVGTHVMHAFRKLGVNSRVGLARIYLERGSTVG